MTLGTLLLRSLRHHAASHAAVAAGVAVATAVITGALLVGDALRLSLRTAALGGLGRLTHAVEATHWFRAPLAAALTGENPGASADRAVAVALLSGTAASGDGAQVVPRVTIVGCQPELADAFGTPGALAALQTSGQGEDTRRAVLSDALAHALGANVGDDVLLRVARPATIAPETLLGRRDTPLATLRVRVAGVAPDGGLGGLRLRPSFAPPLAAFVPRAVLQQALGQPERANAVLISAAQAAADAPAEDSARAAALAARLRRGVRLADYGLRLRTDAARDCVVLTSEALLLPAPVEAAGRAAAAALGARPVGILAYLANEIAIAERTGASVPYSTVVGVESDPTPDASARGPDDLPRPVPDDLPRPPDGAIVLNDWTAAQLFARVGETVRLTYYRLAGAELLTDVATFHLAAVVPLVGSTADPGLAPEYPGVTDALHIAEWDPPFPIDLRRVRPADEDYWSRHRATPKAFVSLADAQRLWAADHERFGRLTSLRVYPPADARAGTDRADGLPPADAPADRGVSAGGFPAAFEHELLARLDPAAVGLRVEDLRSRALAASRGTTDFAGLFLGFSFFLLVAALLLTGLLLRLAVDRRAAELGLLQAVGWRAQRVGRLLLAEQLLVAGLGTLGGLALGRGYAGLLLTGLRSWWAAALPGPALALHDVPRAYLLGAAAGFVVSALTIALTLRGLRRWSVRGLLAGVAADPPRRASGRRRLPMPPRLLTAACAAGALIIAIASLQRPSAPLVFFVSAVLVLLWSLLHVRYALHRRPADPTPRGGWLGILRLGLRNARRRPGRSLLTVALVAAATFVITALQALRLPPPPDPTDRTSGTGGFALVVETTVPLVPPLHTPTGQELLALSDYARARLARATVASLRVRPGDDASCLSPFAPQQPTVLGVGDDLIERGGFAFAASLAQTDAERANPWLLLRRALPDGAIPALADEAAARWQMHRDIGDDVELVDDRGRPTRLRLVGLLRGSMLQGAVLIGERDFTRLFPTRSGHAQFLIAAPPAEAAALADVLHRELADFGATVTPTRDRLAELNAVQNTYLAAFQALGGLGFLLGTLGLAAVQVRQVRERRGELALLRTVGWSHGRLALLLLVEHAALLASGLVCGAVSAAIVAMPHVLIRGVPVPWLSLAGLCAGVLAAGVLSGAAVLAVTLRAPLVPALRRE